MNKIRIRHGENEIEVEGENKFIQKQIEEFYKKIASLPSRITPTSLKQEILEPISKVSSARHMTPAEFYNLKSKGKTDGITNILIFGKYLEEFRGISEFSRQDINELASKAKLSKDIHTQYFTNAVKQGLLRSHGRSRYSLTLSAESVVATM